MTGIAPQRFALEVFPDGGILLDLESGTLLRLNLTSAFVWQRILEGADPDEVAAEFATCFEVDEAVARRDVAAAMIVPPSPADSSRAPTEFWYELVGEHYAFSLRGVPILEITTTGESFRWLDGATPTDLAVALSAVSPKLVALRGASVLHGSAVMRADGGVTAFLGESGAGKTTTARAFARAGSRLICEDKLVLQVEGGRPVAVLAAEERLNAWMKEARARSQASGPGAWCDTQIPPGVAAGPAGPLTDIVLVNRECRRGTTIDLQPLGPTEATAAIFMNGFYGSSAPADWRRNLNATATMARTARTFRATMPAGLEALDAAARHYTEMTAS